MNISIIIRTLGRSTLPQAIASVAAQGRSDVEVIVVDASGRLQLPTVEGVPVRLVSQGRPLHRSVAATVGLAAVTTRWAGFLDDDDLLLPGHLDKLMAALQAEPLAVLAHSGVEVVQEMQAGPAAPQQHEPTDEGPGEPGDAVPGAAVAPPRFAFDAPFEPWELLLGNRMPIHAALFDAERVQSAHAAFDPALDLYEDWDFWLQLRELGPFIHAPGVTARYVVHEGSSGVHRVEFGDDTYWRVWLKWWPRAPRDWWIGVLRAGAAIGQVREELAATRRDLIGKLDAQHAQLVAALDDAWRLRRDVELHLQELAATRQALDESRELVDTTVAQRDAVSTALAQAQQSLVTSQGELATTREQLVVEQQSTALLQQALTDTQHGLEQASRGLADAQAALSARDRELVEVRHSLADSEQSLVRQRIETQRALEDVQAMRQSRFWRLTAPLRLGVDKLRQARAWAASVRRSNGSLRRLAAAPGAGRAYEQWIEHVESADLAQRPAVPQVPLSMRFSVLMPVYNPPLALLDEAIESLRAQSHSPWELCLADDASTDAGVRDHLRAWAAREPRLRLVERPVNGHISAASNSALAAATAEWVVLLDQDDVLAPHALAELAAALVRHPDAGILYSDEDKLDSTGRRFEPYFKPAFNLELLRGQNLISHLGAYRRSLVLEVGGFREGFEGSQDHDLALRCAERLQPSQVVHIPRVLYHWRASDGSTAAGGEQKPYAADAGLRAVQDHLARTSPGSVAETLPGLSYFRVRLALPRVLPAVQAVVVVPAIDEAALAWARGFRESAGHPGFDVRLLAAAPGEMARPLASLLRASPETTVPFLIALRYGVMPARPGWLAEMLSVACQPGVGVVGPRVESAAGDLVDGCLIGGPQVAWRGVGRRQGGHFGRALLRQAVSAVGPSALMIRREAALALLDGPLGAAEGPVDPLADAWRFCAAVRDAGWRVVWTPFAVLAEGGNTLSTVPLSTARPDDAIQDDPAGHPQLWLCDGQLVIRGQASALLPRPGF